MAQAYQLPFLIHDELRKELSQERATKIAELLEKSVGSIFETAKDIAVQKKLEIKDELSKELASKADIALVRADFALVEERLNKKLTVWSIIIVSVIIFTNKDSLTFLAQLLGIIK